MCFMRRQRGVGRMRKVLYKVYINVERYLAKFDVQWKWQFG